MSSKNLSVIFKALHFSTYIIDECKIGKMAAAGCYIFSLVRSSFGGSKVSDLWRLLYLYVALPLKARVPSQELFLLFGPNLKL